MKERNKYYFKIFETERFETDLVGKDRASVILIT